MPHIRFASGADVMVFVCEGNIMKGHYYHAASKTTQSVSREFPSPEEAAAFYENRIASAKELGWKEES